MRIRFPLLLLIGVSVDAQTVFTPPATDDFTGRPHAII
jgi:hypothetical protein